VHAGERFRGNVKLELLRRLFQVGKRDNAVLVLVHGLKPSLVVEPVVGQRGGRDVNGRLHALVHPWGDIHPPAAQHSLDVCTLQRTRPRLLRDVPPPRGVEVGDEPRDLVRREA